MIDNEDTLAAAGFLYPEALRTFFSEVLSGDTKTAEEWAAAHDLMVQAGIC